MDILPSIVRKFFERSWNRLRILRKIIYELYHEFCIEYEIPVYGEPYVRLYHHLMLVIYGNKRASILDQCVRTLQSPGVTPDIIGYF